MCCNRKLLQYEKQTDLRSPVKKLKDIIAGASIEDAELINLKLDLLSTIIKMNTETNLYMQIRYCVDGFAIIKRIDTLQNLKRFGVGEIGGVITRD